MVAEFDDREPVYLTGDLAFTVDEQCAAQDLFLHPFAVTIGAVDLTVDGLLNMVGADNLNAILTCPIVGLFLQIDHAL